MTINAVWPVSELLKIETRHRNHDLVHWQVKHMALFVAIFLMGVDGQNYNSGK